MTDQEFVNELNNIINYNCVNNSNTFKKVGLLYLIYFWLDNFITSKEDKEAIRLIKLDICFNNYEPLLLYLKMILNTKTNVNIPSKDNIIYKYIKDNI